MLQGRVRTISAAGVLLLAVGVVLSNWLHSDPLPRPDARRIYKQVAGGALHLHVFAAKQVPDSLPRPAILWFHGGAWARGSPAQFYPQCLHLRQLGMTCISVEYRLRDRHGSTPADAVQDARDAIRYVRRHASDLGIDPRQVAAGGGSAGGQLAAALGVGVSLPDPDFDPLTPVRPDALVLYNPMLDLRPGRPDHELVGTDWMHLSPREHVRAGMPPTLILSGTADTEVPVSTVQDFCAAVEQSGGSCALALFEGAGHGFFNPEVAKGLHHKPTNDVVARFLRQQHFLP